MSTEPHIKDEHVKAALSGSLHAMIVPIVFILFFIFGEIFFPPENPENDGYLKGFIMIIGLMLPLLSAYFIYFMFMCIGRNMKIRTAFIISLPIAFIMGRAQLSI